MLTKPVSVLFVFAVLLSTACAFDYCYGTVDPCSGRRVVTLKYGEFVDGCGKVQTVLGDCTLKQIGFVNTIQARRACWRSHPLVCNFHPTVNSTARGRVIFRGLWVPRKGCHVYVTGQFWGLTPGTSQGWHIHAYGDITKNDGKSTGGHFTNPRMEKTGHGLPGGRRHWGDLGNLDVRRDGVAHARLVDDQITLQGILGRGMIIHAKQDQGTQPTGAAGARMAQCVIGYRSPKPWSVLHVER